LLLFFFLSSSQNNNSSHDGGLLPEPEIPKFSQIINNKIAEMVVFSQKGGVKKKH
jgi:hypothetical protein